MRRNRRSEYRYIPLPTNRVRRSLSPKIGQILVIAVLFLTTVALFKVVALLFWGCYVVYLCSKCHIRIHTHRQQVDTFDPARPYDNL